MAQQKITIGNTGADSRRVLEALTPINATVSPAVNAQYLGQIYVDSTAGKVYIAVAVGSTTKANDWKEVTNVA